MDGACGIFYLFYVQEGEDKDAFHTCILGNLFPCPSRFFSFWGVGGRGLEVSGRCFLYPRLSVLSYLTPHTHPSLSFPYTSVRPPPLSYDPSSSSATYSSFFPPPPIDVAPVSKVIAPVSIGGYFLFREGRGLEIERFVKECGGETRILEFVIECEVVDEEEEVGDALSSAARVI